MRKARAYQPRSESYFEAPGARAGGFPEGGYPANICWSIEMSFFSRCSLVRFASIAPFARPRQTISLWRGAARGGANVSPGDFFFIVVLFAPPPPAGSPPPPPPR